jgi:ribosomal protein S18 acetylase RimI-like enzyme
MTNTPFTIRQAALADAPAIVRVHITSWQEAYKGIVDQDHLDNLSYSDRLARREKILSATGKDSIHLVALVDNQIVGFCDAGPSFEASQDYIGEIHTVYIIEPFKHLGIGTALMKAAISHLTEKKLIPYIIHVLSDNLPARSFYERFGGTVYQEVLSPTGGKDYLEATYIFQSTPLIRQAALEDIPALVALSHAKRAGYAHVHPQFWRAAVGADEIQQKWFEELLDHKDYVLLVATEASEEITGFIVGQMITAPEVYDPGGLTLSVDDFCVITPDAWERVGGALLDQLQMRGKELGCVQVRAVAGDHDEPKCQFLESRGLIVASRWYVKRM